MSHASSETSHWGWRLALFAIMGVGLALRCYRLGAESIDLEEYACIGALDAPNLWRFLIEQRALYPYGAPLVPVLFYLWSGIVGTSIIAMRLLVLAFGMGLIPLMYWAGVAIFKGERGRWAGLVAALCTALSPVFLFHAHEARMYAPFCFFAALSFVSLYLAERGQDPFWGRVNTFANACVMLSHLFGVFLVAGQGLWLLIRLLPQWRRLIRWSLAQAAVAAPVLLWTLTAPEAGGTLYSYYQPPSFQVIFSDFFADDVVHRSTLALWASPPERFPWPEWHAPLHAAGSAWLDPLLLGMGILAVAGCVFGVLRQGLSPGGAPRAASALLLFAWYAFPLSLIILVSYLSLPVYASRYAAYGQLALYLMLGYGVSLLPWRILRAAAVSLLCVLYGYQLIISLPGPMRTEWREMMNQVAAESTPDAPLLVEDPFWLPLARLNRTDDGRVIEGGYKRDALCDAAVRCAQAFPGPQGGAWIVLLDFILQGPEATVACLRARGVEVKLVQYFGERRPYLIHVTVPEGEGLPPCAVPAETSLLRDNLGTEFVKTRRGYLRYEPDERAGLYLRLAFTFLERGAVDAACSMLARAQEIGLTQETEPHNFSEIMQGLHEARP